MTAITNHTKTSMAKKLIIKTKYAPAMDPINEDTIIKDLTLKTNTILEFKEENQKKNIIIVNLENICVNK